MRRIITAAVVAVVAAAGLAAQERPIYEPGNGVKAPVLVKEVKPKYTEGAMRRKVEGMVEMKAVVLPSGLVREDVKVTRSLDAELDEQAIAALRQWEFKPGTKDGEPVPVQVAIEMSFSLRRR